MFAIDGCKLPSNASKEWSGTKADFTKKKEKIDQTILYILKKHRSEDEEKASIKTETDAAERHKATCGRNRRRSSSGSQRMDTR